jgi:hypothetical protein
MSQQDQDYEGPQSSVALHLWTYAELREEPSHWAPGWPW